MKKYLLIFFGLILSLFFAFSLFGAEEPKYTNESFARLSYLSGSAFIQKGPELGFEEVVVNMPIEAGDRIGTTEGRAEIYLGKKNYVRLDHNTKLDFLDLPRSGSDLIRLRLWAGNIYLSVSRLKKEKAIEVHSADISFYVLDEGLYRIDVSENKKTAIFVFNGLIEAAGEEGSLLLKSEQSVEASDGRFDSKPKRFFAVAEDDFDRWSAFRESHLRADLNKRFLPEELEDFEKELDEYGEWVYLSPYGWVWVPGGLDADWRPYYRGRWVWLTLGGWTWLPYEPWGWVTFHYGRWHWGADLGWYWIPASVWGPAWVWWYWGYDYFGWAPLSWWGYPVVVLDGRFYGRYYGPYYPYHSRALTVIHKDQLKAKDVSTVALKPDSLKNLSSLTLSKEPPPIRPTVGKITVEPIEGNRVLLKKTPDSGTIPERSLKLPAGDTLRRAPGAPLEDSARPESSPSPERRIRRKDSTEAGRASFSPGTKSGERGIVGYPPSPSITGKKSEERGLTSRPTSFRERLYRYLSGERSSSRGSSSRGSISRGSGSSASRSRGSISSAPRSSSSSSRPSSSGRSGGVRRKN